MITFSFFNASFLFFFIKKKLEINLYTAEQTLRGMEVQEKGEEKVYNIKESFFGRNQKEKVPVKSRVKTF